MKTKISLLVFKVTLLKLNSIYLVFYILLLEPFNLKRLILYSNILIIDILYNFRDNIYKVDRIVN